MSERSVKPTGEPLFREVQHFSQWWMRLLMFFPVAIVLFGGYVRFVLNQPFGHIGPKPAPLWLDSMMFLLIGFGIPLLYYSMKLVIEVFPEGFYFRFYPFHWHWHRIAMTDIQKVTAKTYRPILEYGGWGIRYGVSGKAYNVSGNQGVLIEFNEGKKILFGSQKMLEMEMILKQYLAKSSSSYLNTSIRESN